MRTPLLHWLLGLTLVGIVLDPAYADEPPSWEPFEVCTEEGHYCAEIKPATESSPPWDAEHQLTIWKNFEGRRRALWSRRYEFDGYSGGVLTPDAKTFVHVSSWYYPETVITIYGRHDKFEVSGRSFRIDSAKLQRTVSHQLWLTSETEPYEIVENDKLAVTTIDGRRHLIDLSTGQLVKESEQDAEPADD